MLDLGPGTRRLRPLETETETETEVLGALLAACHPLCVALVCLVLRFLVACAHSIHARMGKRRSEDDGLELVVESEAVPPRTRLGIVCCEISVMVRQMTRRIFWRVVMSDMAHLNRLVLQNQQTLALPEWQQGSGSRSSNG